MAAKIILLVLVVTVTCYAKHVVLEQSEQDVDGTAQQTSSEESKKGWQPWKWHKKHGYLAHKYNHGKPSFVGFSGYPTYYPQLHASQGQNQGLNGFGGFINNQGQNEFGASNTYQAQAFGGYLPNLGYHGYGGYGVNQDQNGFARFGAIQGQNGFGGIQGQNDFVGVGVGQEYGGVGGYLSNQGQNGVGGIQEQNRFDDAGSNQVMKMETDDEQ